MTPFQEMLFTRVWWKYDRQDEQWFSGIYHWFNLFEGMTWLVLAVIVLLRYLKHRHSPLEILYGALFLTFAATDFCEAWEQSSWLIWLKLFNLLTLLWVRHAVMKCWYPSAKVY